MDDPFIREHIEDLLRNIRTQVLIKLIKPYTRIKISFISGELNIEPSDVESLLVSCILESTIYGRIDQVCLNQNLVTKILVHITCFQNSSTCADRLFQFKSATPLATSIFLIMDLSRFARFDP